MIMSTNGDGETVPRNQAPQSRHQAGIRRAERKAARQWQKRKENRRLKTSQKLVALNEQSQETLRSVDSQQQETKHDLSIGQNTKSTENSGTSDQMATSIHEPLEAYSSQASNISAAAEDLQSWVDLGQGDMVYDTSTEMQSDRTSEGLPEHDPTSNYVQDPLLDTWGSEYVYGDDVVIARPIAPTFDNTAAVQPPYNGPPAIVSSTSNFPDATPSKTLAI
jgi:hypothetical protein